MCLISVVIHAKRSSEVIESCPAFQPISELIVLMPLVGQSGGKNIWERSKQGISRFRYRRDVFFRYKGHAECFIQGMNVACRR